MNVLYLLVCGVVYCHGRVRPGYGKPSRDGGYICEIRGRKGNGAGFGSSAAPKRHVKDKNFQEKDHAQG